MTKTQPAQFEVPVDRSWASTRVATFAMPGGEVWGTVEVRDGLFRPGHYWFLACNGRKLDDRAVDDLRVPDRGAEAHIDDDALEPRDLHRALVAKALHERGHDFLLVPRSKTGFRHVTHGSSLSHDDGAAFGDADLLAV